MLPQLAGLRGLFTVAAGAFAIVVFIFDTVSPREISVATLYVLVVMIAAVGAQETIRDLHRKLARRVEQSTTELARASRPSTKIPISVSSNSTSAIRAPSSTASMGATTSGAISRRGRKSSTRC